MRENICNRIDKGLVSKIYKQLMWFNIKKKEKQSNQKMGRRSNFTLLQRRRIDTRKTSSSASLTMLKASTVWITTNWKILQEMGISDHVTCLLRNEYAPHPLPSSLLSVFLHEFGEHVVRCIHVYTYYP